MSTLESFEVSQIMDIKFNSEKARFEFEVKWKQSKKFPEPINTWEPMSNLFTCPKLLLDFEQQQWKQWQSYCAELREAGKLDDHAGFLPALWKEPLAGGPVWKNFDWEYQMTGIEKVAKIYSMEEHPLLVKKGESVLGTVEEGGSAAEETNKVASTLVPYFMVRFFGDSSFHYVQRAYLEYFSPAKLAIYLYEDSLLDGSASKSRKIQVMERKQNAGLAAAKNIRTRKKLQKTNLVSSAADEKSRKEKNKYFTKKPSLQGPKPAHARYGLRKSQRKKIV
jgi:hypothetical protein